MTDAAGLSCETQIPAPTRREQGFSLAVFGVCLLFNLWGVSVGWRSLNLPGHEFRQAQTALSIYHIGQTRDFSADYPTPVLGKPWAIPLEFPLYQWAVLGVDDATNLGLIKSGRLVSLASFYLMLPALFLLLGQAGVAPGRRLLVLALVLTSPVYIFYSRALLIETMALMFSLWFWVAFERTVVTRGWPWLVLANLAGAAAGLVKATTWFVFAVPILCWTLRRLLAAGPGKKSPVDFRWMAGAIVAPIGVTLAWTWHAEAVRALNPLAHFLVGAPLREFTFGTWATRLSPELWLQKWNNTVQGVTCWPALVAGVFIAVFFARTRGRLSLALTGWYVAVMAIFPVVYGFHDYYFVANGVLLLAAVGLAVIGLVEAGRAWWLPSVLILALGGGQVWQYFRGYYVAQSGISQGGSGLTLSLKGVTDPADVLVIVGQQWNPMVPFYAQRRAMMITDEDERNGGRLELAFAALAGEKIGALAISDPVKNPAEILQRAAVFGIAKQPIFRWRDVTVYVREDQRDECIRAIQRGGFPEVALLPGVEPQPEKLSAIWIEVARLPAAQRGFFVGMNPRPVRLFSSFGPGIELAGGRHDFGAHPVTRLVFSLPAGEHRMRTTVSLPPEAYRTDDPASPPSDGVEITLSIPTLRGERRVLFTRLLNPRDQTADRGRVELSVPFRLEQAGEVELYFGPGPAGRDTHDWIVLGELVFD